MCRVQPTCGKQKYLWLYNRLGPCRAHVAMAVFIFEWVKTNFLVNQVLLHYYTSTLFIWGWGGGGCSLVVQVPDYCPVVLRAHFAKKCLILLCMVHSALFLLHFLCLSLACILFILEQNNQGQLKIFCWFPYLCQHFWPAIQGSSVS